MCMIAIAINHKYYREREQCDNECYLEKIILILCKFVIIQRPHTISPERENFYNNENAFQKYGGFSYEECFCETRRLMESEILYAIPNRQIILMVKWFKATTLSILEQSKWEFTKEKDTLQFAIAR